MSELTQQIARQIVQQVGGPGQPPVFGVQFYSAGLEPYLSAITEEYLASFIKQGGSTFKMVVGAYGGGETHFLYCVRDIALEHNYAVSYVSLSPGQSPFSKLELVYSAIARGILPPLKGEEWFSPHEKGIGSLLKIWYMQCYRKYQAQGLSREMCVESLRGETEQLGGIDSLSFSRATKAAFRALVDGDDVSFENIHQWLVGEGYNRAVHGRYGILQRIDKSTAPMMLRSLAQWVRSIGYSGLIVLLDEAERVPSLSSREREQLLSNLRELIDECAQTSFQNAMVFYAVPDENFLEGRAQVYEALRQRLATVFSDINPSGVKIKLEDLASDPIAVLKEIGAKLGPIYEMAYDCRLDPSILQQTVEMVSQAAFEQRFGDIGYRRLFVQKLIPALHFVRTRGTTPSPTDLGF